MQVDSPASYAISGRITDATLGGIFANMSSAGYEYTGESSHRYESMLQSDDFLGLNSTQKQALTDGGFIQTAENTVVSTQDTMYYNFTNSSTKNQVYVQGIQRIDASGNPVGSREYTISPEFTPDGSAASPNSVQGGYGISSAGHHSCFWQWFAVILVGVIILAILAALIFFTAGTYTLVAAAQVSAAIWFLGTAAGSMIGGTFAIVEPAGQSTAFTGWAASLSGADILFSASMIAALVAALLAFAVLFLYALYELGVCMGWIERGFWNNHNWDHENGDFGPADNGQTMRLYPHDRIMLNLFADTAVDKDASWTVRSQGNLITRKEGTIKTDNGTSQSWILEAADLGPQDLTLEYRTSKPVPPAVGTTPYTLHVIVVEIPWTITTVDSDFNPGEGEPLHSISQYISLKIDPSNTPRIGYFEDDKQRIMYASMTNGAWTSEKVTDAGGYGSVSLALDPQGNPGISYGGWHLDMGLMYAHKNGSAWSSEKVADGVGYWKIGESGTGYFSSLVIDSGGIPHITYNNGLKRASTAVMYATKDGNAWKNVPSLALSPGYDSSLALDRNGRLHVAYRPTDKDGSIKYAEQDGSDNWLVKTVANAYGTETDSKRHAGYHISLALDSQEFPHISYYDESEKDLKYVSWNGTAWNTETVHATGNVGKFPSLVINADDQPYIGYYDVTDKELRFATKFPGSTRWEIHTVDSSTTKNSWCGAGEYVSVALDQNGHPAMAYYDCMNHALKYAEWKA
jgi:hypothetical protein